MSFGAISQPGQEWPLDGFVLSGGYLHRLITDKTPQDAFERLEEDELITLAECDELKHRFSVEFLSTIDKSLYMSRHERWQSAGVWLNELGPAAELQQIFC